jgi:PAS domain S-box-containing protein
MRISLRLTAAFLAIASLVGAAGYLAQRTTEEVRTQIRQLKENAAPRIAGASQTTAALYALQLAAHELVSVERRHGRGEAAAGISHRQASIEELRARVEQGLEKLRLAAASQTRGNVAGTTAAVPEERTPSETSFAPLFQASWLSHQQLLDDVRRTAPEDADLAHRWVEERLFPHFERELLPLLVDQRDQSERELTEAINGVERSLAAADVERGLLTLAAAASAVLIGLFMSRSIGRPLTLLQRAAQELGRGHFDTRIPVRSQDEIGILGHALNQMAADLQEKTVSRSYLENILRSMHEMLIVTDHQARICRLNPTACAELGLESEALVGRPLRERFVGESLPADGDFPQSLANGVESVMRSQTQGLIPVLCSIAAMRDDRGRLEGFVCVAWNISRQKDTEQRLRASLREKELLLKEVHHRVKNNLQVISSLLSLQAQELSDPRLVRLLQESQGRVHSLALIHEQLYRSQDLAQIDFAAYVRELVGHLAQGLGRMAAGVSFRFDLEPSLLPLDLAIPCGMIINELVSNALEHAFPQGRSGSVRIAFRGEAADYELTVADDGVGLSEGKLAAKPGSLGLKVVQALTRQLRGRLDVQSLPGAAFTIHFSAPLASASPPPIL